MCKINRLVWIFCKNVYVRAIILVDVKLCKMEKCAHFTQFEQKNTHISGCKLV